MTRRPFNVLFICTGNSARSILAESVLRKDGSGRFNAYSASATARLLKPVRRGRVSR